MGAGSALRVCCAVLVPLRCAACCRGLCAHRHTHLIGLLRTAAEEEEALRERGRLPGACQVCVSALLGHSCAPSCVLVYAMLPCAGAQLAALSGQASGVPTVPGTRHQHAIMSGMGTLIHQALGAGMRCWPPGYQGQWCAELVSW